MWNELMCFCNIDFVENACSHGVTNPCKIVYRDPLSRHGNLRYACEMNDMCFCDIEFVKNVWSHRRFVTA